MSWQIIGRVKVYCAISGVIELHFLQRKMTPLVFLCTRIDVRKSVLDVCIVADEKILMILQNRSFKKKSRVNSTLELNT